MFSEMRRKDKEKSREEAERIIRDCPNGVLSVMLEDGYPYGVPVSQVYHDGNIYFHSAAAGQKYQVLLKNPKVCFTVTEKDTIVPGKFTTYYSSAVAFGTASLVKDEAEIARVLDLLVEKLDPEHIEGGRKYAAGQQGKFSVFKITVDHLTAKGLG